MYIYDHVHTQYQHTNPFYVCISHESPGWLGSGEHHLRCLFLRFHGTVSLVSFRCKAADGSEHYCHDVLTCSDGCDHCRSQAASLGRREATTQFLNGPFSGGKDADFLFGANLFGVRESTEGLFGANRFWGKGKHGGVLAIFKKINGIEIELRFPYACRLEGMRIGSWHEVSRWVWVKIEPAGIGPQVLVHVSIC